MNIKKVLLISIGVILLVLGAMGIVVPVLPTTPFVLAASGCFASTSPQMYQWLSKSKYFGEFIVVYKTKAGVSRGTKIKALVFLYVMMGISVYLIPITHVRILLFIVGCGVTIHILMMKTKK